MKRLKLPDELKRFSDPGENSTDAAEEVLTEDPIDLEGSNDDEDED